MTIKLPGWLTEILMRLIWLCIGGFYHNQDGVKPMNYEAYKHMVKKDKKLL